MCGLVGMAGDLTFKHRNVMKDLLFFNTLRGRDSTGVAAYDQGRNMVDLKKVTVPGFEFVGLPFIDGLLGSMVGAWIGHGRHKTVGDVSRINAHPFEVRNDAGRIELFGAHNGTLKNKWEIEKKLDGAKFGTDSEALFNLIHKMGAKEAIAEADGAWALSYWAAATGQIHLIRNKERPLHYAYSADKKTLIWASEAWMIRIACDRHDLSLLTVEGKTAVYLLAEDTLYSWDIPTFKFNGDPKEKEFQAPEREGGVEGKPPPRFPAPVKPPFANPKPAVDGGWYGQVDWFGDDDDDAAKLRNPIAQAKAQAGKENETREGKVVGFEGKLMDPQLVQEFVRAGCDWCGGNITSGFGWMDEMNLVCSSCMKDSHVDVDPKEGTISLRVIEGGKK